MRKTISRILRRIQNADWFRIFGRSLINRLRLVNYRIAAPEDRDGLARFLYKDPAEREAFKEEKQDFQDRTLYILARFYKTIIGMAVISRDQCERQKGTPDDWWLSGLFVPSVLRGLGIGQGIVNRAIQETLSLKAKHLNLIVNKDNLPTIALYEKLGFRSMPKPLLESNKHILARLSPQEIILSCPLPIRREN